MNTITSEEFITKRKHAKYRASTHNHPKVLLEHNIPVPTTKRGGARVWDHFYPFESMAPGDSFWVESSSNCTSGAVTQFAKKSGWKFITRAQSKDGVPNRICANSKRGTRVWRVA